jgi:RHS repeat-associated protein
MINTSNSVVARYLYDPYGRILSQSGLLAGANLYRFSSKEAHLNSGLIYYLYRFYDPNLQRWPNRDPIVEPGFDLTQRHQSRPGGFWSGVSAERRRALLTQSGIVIVNYSEFPLVAEGANDYSFCKNDPVIFTDPDGRTTAACLSSMAWCIGGMLAVPTGCATVLGCIGTILGGPVAGCIAMYDNCQGMGCGDMQIPGNTWWPRPPGY